MLNRYKNLSHSLSVFILAAAVAVFLSSCSFFRLGEMNNYEDVARFSNTLWAELYFTFNDVKFPGYDRIIYKDTRWRAGDSPVVIDKNTYILPGVTLTIDPGVEVLLGNNVKVTIRGGIFARGTRDKPVVFTWVEKGRNWSAIEVVSGIEGSGKSADTDTVVFENCIFEHGGTIKIVSSHASVRSCVFRDNNDSALKFYYTGGVIADSSFYRNSTFHQSESGNGAAINIYTDKEVLVKGNEIYDNVSDGGRDGGGGICAFAYDRGKVSIIDNLVRNNRSDRKGGGIFAYASRVTGNRVLYNEAALRGGGLYVIDCAVANNVVAFNSAPDGGGVYSEAGSLAGNLVRGNRACNGSGLYCFGDSDITCNSFLDNVPMAKGEKGGSTIAVLGNPRIWHNNIIARAGYALSFQSHELAPDLQASGNYWGTADRRVISELISDWFENTSVGLVNWQPFLEHVASDAYPPPSGSVLSVSRAVSRPGPGELRGLVDSDLVIGSGQLRHYTVTGNLLIDSGTTLSIRPGTTLALAKDATVRVRGRLKAVGKKNSPVRFTGKDGNTWGNLFFENRSTGPSAGSGPGKEPAVDKSRSIMRYCVVEKGHGVVMDGQGADLFNCIVRNNSGTGLRIKEVSVSVKNCKIYGNVSNSDGGGVYVYGSHLVYIEGNEIRENRAADGGGIFAYGYQSNAAVDIRNNLIEKNYSAGDGGGVWMSRSSMVGNTVTGNRAEASGGGVYCSFALVGKNRIIGNTAHDGGGIYVEANGSVSGNLIAGNTATGPRGGGACLDYWGVSMHNKMFSGNTIEENTASGPHPAGGVCLNGDMEFSGNVIRNNTGIQLWNLNPADEDKEPFSAHGCYWGTVSKRAIENLIHDGKDDPALSIVDYEPFARTAAQALHGATDLEQR